MCKSEIPPSVLVSGDVIETVVNQGSRNENHYFKIGDDARNEEFNEIGENYGFDKFVNKRVEIKGFREIE